MNPVEHFEIPCDEPERAVAFYTDVFGWKVQKVEGIEHDYWMAYTTEVDDKHMPKRVCVINGGIYRRPDKVPKGTSIVITVPSIEEHLEKVKENGGKHFFGPAQVGEMGKYAQVYDPEGNLIGLWEELH